MVPIAIKPAQDLFIGTAGWNVPARHAACFPPVGSHLERYASWLNAAEINSSFYRPHQRKTYEHWAQSTPKRFRFSVKLPRTITHGRRLADSLTLLDRFLSETAGLGEKLAVLLVQLPPALAFDEDVALPFFEQLRQRTPCAIACEPRHATWFSDAAETALENLGVARVAADPPRAKGDGVPGGWKKLAYYRLHGSPKIYYSDYDDAALTRLARTIRQSPAESIWCIFDNTAAFAALGNAMALHAKLCQP